ncbi:MAG TPA: response regulator [Armatimonadota bacterium]|nr:response regulator [Armatimonadota bacterium]HOM71421.1 response regulator [Armatimonadota bacterium]HPP75098.1 response regulator [Armatimonadota bacterium]
MTARILVVDDEAGLRTVLQDILELEGHEVEACEDSTSARSLLDSKPFNAALVDVFLTEEPAGIELAKHIQQVSPETKVILMTGYAEESDIKDGYISGAYACIRKPFLLDDVIRVVSTALGG